jgi:hypothetical protein
VVICAKVPDRENALFSFAVVYRRFREKSTRIVPRIPDDLTLVRSATSQACR